jgi:hypothetical protein
VQVPWSVQQRETAIDYAAEAACSGTAKPSCTLPRFRNSENVEVPLAMKSARIPEHDSRDQAALFSGQAHVPLMPFAAGRKRRRNVISKTYKADIRFSYWTI